MEHPTLYKRGAAAGVMLQWRVWTEGPTLFTEHGQVGGKLQRSPGNAKEGKNPGKANETTAEQQAAKEALAAWEKRIKRGGYKADIEEAKRYLHAVPMLAHKYPEHLAKGKVRFPVLVQPKLDGLRSPGYVKGGKPILQSRKLTHYTAPKHILAELKVALGDSDLILDGELYCHEMSLNEINSAGKKYHAGDTERLKLHVYDCTRQGQQGQTQDARHDAVIDFFTKLGDSCTHIVRVPTYRASSDEDVQRLNAKFLAEGYEGAIIRTLDHTYEFDTRSHGLLKLKDHLEQEFEIVGMAAGSGKAAKWPVFTCKNPRSTKGETFDVLPKGDDKAKRAMLALGDVVIGRMLTVRFHQWTAYGQPEHPRGITIREDIDQ